MAKELGYGKRFFGNNIRFYRVKKNDQRIQVIRVTENMYQKLKKMAGYIQMNYAVNSYFNSYRIAQETAVRERLAKSKKLKLKPIEKTGLWEKIKQWFKKNIISKLVVDKEALKKLKGR